MKSYVKNDNISVCTADNMKYNTLYIVTKGQSIDDIGIIAVRIGNEVYTLYSPNGTLTPFSKWGCNVYNLDDYRFAEYVGQLVLEN